MNKNDIELMKNNHFDLVFDLCITLCNCGSCISDDGKPSCNCSPLTNLSDRYFNVSDMKFSMELGYDEPLLTTLQTTALKNGYTLIIEDECVGTFCKLDKVLTPSFILSFHASGTTGTFNYLIVAKDIDTAKELWSDYVSTDSNNYFWEKAVKGTVYHTGGYVSWKENGYSEKAVGCYKLEYNAWNVGSDHLWD